MTLLQMAIENEIAQTEKLNQLLATVADLTAQVSAIQQTVSEKAYTCRPMLGNEAFDASSLSPEAQVWHARLVAMDVTQPYVYAQTADAENTRAGMEIVGEALLFAITPLLQAFRLTGDLRILESETN